MAEEKTILTVDLYDNVLTEKTGDFTGKIRITGTTRTSDISNRIVKKRTEYRPETITNILDLSYDEMIEALAQGRCVVNKFGQWRSLSTARSTERNQTSALRRIRSP